MEAVATEVSKVCPNCASPYSEQQGFCGQCGQKLRLPRLTTRMLLREVWNTVTNLERGFFYTLQELVLRPGVTMRRFWDGARIHYYPPLRFVFIIVAVSTGLMLISGVYDQIMADTQQGFVEGLNEQSGADKPEVAEAQARFQQEYKKYIHVVALFMMPFIAFFSRLFFKKYGRNFAEHLVAVSYFTAAVTGLGIVVNLVIIAFPSVYSWVLSFSVLLTLGFFSYAFKHTFQISWWSSIWRSVLSYILGYLMFFIVGMIIGLLVGLGIALLGGFGGGGG